MSNSPPVSRVAEGIAKPRLVAFGASACILDKPLIVVRSHEQPQDVPRRVPRQSFPQPVLLHQAVDDNGRALPPFTFAGAPKSLELGVRGGGCMQHLIDVGVASIDSGAIAGVQPKRPPGVRLHEHLAVPWPVGHRSGCVVPG